jgi:DNA-directed RNA polymerase specialized sigma54-like protein
MPAQQLKVTPKQIAANAILQLSSLELQDAINQELSENPALDLEEQQVCPLCGQPELFRSRQGAATERSRDGAA